MAHQHGACEECTLSCLLIHGQRDPDPSPVVSSFFKVMIDKHFKRVLYIPPKFAGLVSHLANEETYLEDSSGQRWKVQLCNRNGPLAIRQGWFKFSSEHDLEMGDFLVFHYIHGQHFVVQIFGRTGCQKIRFNNDTRKGKKRARTSSKQTSQDEPLPETDINVRKKQKSTYASNIDADTGKRQRVPLAVGTSDALQGESRESSPVDGVLAEVEVLTSETPLQFYDVAVQIENIYEPLNVVDVSWNGQPMGLISSACLQPAENGGSHLELQYDKESHYTSSNQVTCETSNEASQFVTETRVDKQELKDMAAKSDSPAEKLTGKESNIVEKDGPPPVTESDCNAVIKSGPADSAETSFPDADSFSYTLQVDGKDGLLLPQCWPKVLDRKKKLGNGFVKLQGPDTRIWSVMYHERPNFKCLGDGWPYFTQVYGLKPGDECVFQLLDPSEYLFRVLVAQKVEVTPISLSDDE